MTIVEFLLARIDEDEATLAPEEGPSSGRNDDGGHAHDLRFDLKRLLAECAAKRQIVEDYRAHHGTRDWARSSKDARQAEHTMSLMLRRLANVYSEHPDHDPAW